VRTHFRPFADVLREIWLAVTPKVLEIFAETTDSADVADKHLLREEWSVRKMVEAIDLNRQAVR